MVLNKKIRRILLVCLGNTARSPAAEYLAKYYASKYHLEADFDSAGFINAFSYMQPESKEFLDSKGINHSDFQPKIINKELIEGQDLIITMEDQHVKRIINYFPEIEGIKDKVLTLKSFNGNGGDIIDPYYTNRTTYIEVLKEIDENIEKMIQKITKINSS